MTAPGGGRPAHAKILWLAEPGVGPILIRGAQVDGAQPLAFGDGTDPSADLVFRAADAVGVAGSATGWSNYVAYARTQGPGCYAYQVDTMSTSEIIVFAAAP